MSTTGQDLTSYKKVQFPAAASVAIVPTAGDITYGQTLGDSVLTGGAGNVAGTFAWKDPSVAPAVADNQKTEYVVVFTPTDERYGTAECKVKLTVNKADSAVTKAPEATNPAYSGSAQALVTIGEASGGTMQYSLDGKSFSEKVPTATEAKSYAVWYKVVGDANHNGTEAESVTSTITKKDEHTPTPEPTPEPEKDPEKNPEPEKEPTTSTPRLSGSGHIQGTGWAPAASDGALAGTTGESRRLEAVRVTLTGGDHELDGAIVLCDANVEVAGGRTYLPIYAAGLI